MSDWTTARMLKSSADHLRAVTNHTGEKQWAVLRRLLRDEAERLGAVPQPARPSASPAHHTCATCGSSEKVTRSFRLSPLDPSVRLCQDCFIPARQQQIRLTPGQRMNLSLYLRDLDPDLDAPEERVDPVNPEIVRESVTAAEERMRQKLGFDPSSV